MTTPPEERRRWLALLVLCLGELMIVLDTTVVTVALPSVQRDLGFTETALVWVVNAYMLTFGGCLLLGGRLGDLYGARRAFLAGVALFTLASLACGLAQTQALLVGARALQGVAGAVVSAVALSLIVNLFEREDERARAMGVYGFVCAGGGSLGVLLGGLLTHALSWHWVFLINLPIGIAVYALSLRLVDNAPGSGGARLDVGGALTITLALMLAVYAVVDGNSAGWLSAQTLTLFAAAAALLALFLRIEARSPAPLVPLGLLRLRQLATANVVGVLWSAAMFAWFFITALYLQQLLHYSPLQVGLAFLPANLLMAWFSLGLSARLVMWRGRRWPVVAGLLLTGAGLACFALAPLGGSYALHVLPGMLLLGLGTGMALNPLLLAAMSDVGPRDAGLASGVVNTSFMMGGALGLAVLASLAGARTASYVGSADAALHAGYTLAFAAGAAFAWVGAALAGLGLRANPSVSEQEPAPAPSSMS